MLVDKPIYKQNKIGLCSLYALCNLFHYEEEGCTDALEIFSERGELGFTLAECDFITKRILGTTRALQICYFSPKIYNILSEREFKIISGIDVIEHALKGSDFIKGMYLPILLNIISKNDEYHSISAYYEFDTEMFIFMDSATNQIWVESWEQFSKREKCYGISIFLETIENEDGKSTFVPVVIERDWLKIFKK